MNMRKIKNKIKREVTNFGDKIYWYKCLIKTIYGKYDKSDYKEEIEYLKKNWKKLKYRQLIIPYEFAEQYVPNDEVVNYDKDNAMLYVEHKGKKLFFPGNNKKWIAKKIANHNMEQDERSPHNYFSKDFSGPMEDEIFIDVGAAEGGEALGVVDTAKKVILIEQDLTWINTLKKTFGRYDNKTEYIKAYASDKSGDELIMLDEIIDENEKYFLKLDVEGAEMDVLRGAEQSLKKGNIRCTVCTYHKETAAKEIYEYLTDLGYECSFSEGYLCIFSRTFKKWNAKAPYFRKGVIKAQK